MAPDPDDSLSSVAFTAVPPEGPAGVPGFHFMPPVVEGPPAFGELDATLLDLLAVEICALTTNGCAAVRTITAQSPQPARLKVSSKGIYAAVWNSGGDGLDVDMTYRIRVLASGGELGHIDVDVVDPGEGPAPGQTDHVRLVKGSTLPISFFVEEGAGAVTGPAGGTVELAGGQVQLEIPAGAVPEDVFFTAVPTTAYPMNGPPVVPGTAWDFGPDGITFATPIVMTIAYDPANIPPGVDENELRIHKVVNGMFVQQNAGLIDVVNHIASAEVDGFSVYVLIPRNPLNPEDIEGPEVRALEVFNAGTGTFGSSTTLDVSSGDATLTTRIEIVDNITGVQWIDIRYLSPTGRQMRFPCYTGNPPTTGSDTNGEWVCDAVFPQHAESGTWQVNFVGIQDKINNTRFYSNRPGGFCDQFNNLCIANPAQVNVTSATPDIDPPALQSFGVSPNVQPRVFGPSASVDVGTTSQFVVFGFQATDNSTGIGGFLPFDGLQVNLTGPSGQFLGAGCGMTAGTSVNGFWECVLFMPAQAETGTWTVSFLRVSDRAGNGGFSGFSDFRPNGAGQLCNQGGNCVTQPTVQVTSAGDGEAPFLTSLNIAAVGADVTTTMGVTDDVTGTSFVRVRYLSSTTTQFQECFGSLTAGSPTNGTWECLITFPQFAARGQWIVSIQLFDGAGNNRFYSRRALDGYLCYFDQATSTQICQDFGDTDIILP